MPEQCDHKQPRAIAKASVRSPTVDAENQPTPGLTDVPLPPSPDEPLSKLPTVQVRHLQSAPPSNVSTRGVSPQSPSSQQPASCSRALPKFPVSFLTQGEPSDSTYVPVDTRQLAALHSSASRASTPSQYLATPSTPGRPDEKIWCHLAECCAYFDRNHASLDT